MIGVTGKRISVIGFGKSGRAVTQLLVDKGAKVFVSDLTSDKEISKELQNMGVEYELGEHTSKITDADFIVLSPGIDSNTGLLSELIQGVLPIYGEIEIASWFCKGKIIAVTGSNGKSTTATLIYKLIKNLGYDAYLAGNIGNPFSSIVDKTSPDSIVILELSSFQLETIESFTPFVSVILNLTPDHLDRYFTVDDYFDAKLRIWMNQTIETFAVINRDDQNLFNYS